MPSIFDQLEPTLRNAMVPALAAGAGTGALSAYVSAKNRDPRETPGARRKRILRNALLGTAVGGMAGAAMPTGAKMLAEPFSRGMRGPGDVAAGVGMRYAAPLATAGVGGAWLAKTEAKGRAEGLEGIIKQLKGEKIPGALNELKPGTRESLLSLAATREGRNSLLQMLSQKFIDHPDSRYSDAALDGFRRLGVDPKNRSGGGAGANNLFLARERLQAGGVKMPGIGELDDVFKQAPGTMLRHYQKYLGEQGPIAKLVGKHLATNETPAAMKNLERFGLVKRLGQTGLGRKAIQAAENFKPSALAEVYARHGRPGMSGFTGLRVPLAAKLGLLGGGVIGANWLQNKVTGQS